MQISDLAKQYTGTNGADGLSGTRGVEQLVSSVRQLTVGNIFEGTVNTIKGNQVLLGLSNGSELAARIEANMQLVQGQSMFFQVKSNDGSTIAIRPYMVDGNGANLTLLNALSAANLPIKDNYLNMANTMMQEQMPIDKNSMAQMARILMANPDMNVQTLVQMRKLGLPVTTEMVAQFENYIDDRSAVHQALDKFVGELPATMSSAKMPLEQLKSFHSELLLLLADGQNIQGAEIDSARGGMMNSQAKVQGMPSATVLSDVQETVQSWGTAEGQNTQAASGQVQGPVTMVPAEGQADLQAGGQIPVPAEGQTDLQAGGQIPVSAEGQGQTPATEAFLRLEAVQTVTPDINTGMISYLFGDIGITKEDSVETVLYKLAQHIAKGENVNGENLRQLFSSKDMQNLLRTAIEKQFYIEPKDVAGGEKLKQLYDRMDGKIQSIENLLNNVGLKETPVAQTIGEIHANIEFMNQLNQAYTYAQIPLRMTNQNASGQLYVYTSKRNLEDPDRDLTAFLHLDLEHLGATDVSVRMHRREVSTKFYMDSDEAYELVKHYMHQLEERLRQKGYQCKIEVANEGRHMNFAEDFLKKDAPATAMIHRYSFDVKA